MGAAQRVDLVGEVKHLWGEAVFSKGMPTRLSGIKTMQKVIALWCEVRSHSCCFETKPFWERQLVGKIKIFLERVQTSNQV